MKPISAGWTRGCFVDNKVINNSARRSVQTLIVQSYSLATVPAVGNFLEIVSFCRVQSGRLGSLSRR